MPYNCIIMNKSLHYLLYVENLMYLYKRHFQVYKINYPVCASSLTIINERLLVNLFVMCHTWDSQIGPAVVPCLRSPVFWTQLDSQLESCGEHHMCNHPKKAWSTEKLQCIRCHFWLCPQDVSMSFSIMSIQSIHSIQLQNQCNKKQRLLVIIVISFYYIVIVILIGIDPIIKFLYQSFCYISILH